MSALSRGLRVLEVLAASGKPLGNADIAAKTGLAKPTISRITYTLSELGYVEYLQETSRYQISGSAVSLGYTALRGNVIQKVALPFMKSLAADTGLSVSLGIRSGFDIVLTANERTEDLVSLRLGPGSRLPLATTGIGHGYLVGLPPAERDTLIHAMQASDAKGMRRAMPHVRSSIRCFEEHGFAYVVSLWHPHTNGVGVPLVPEDGTSVVSFNCGGFSEYCPERSLVSELGPALVEMVERVKAALNLSAHATQ